MPDAWRVYDSRVEDLEREIENLKNRLSEVTSQANQCTTNQLVGTVPASQTVQETLEATLTASAASSTSLAALLPIAEVQAAALGDLSATLTEIFDSSLTTQQVVGKLDDKLVSLTTVVTTLSDAVTAQTTCLEALHNSWSVFGIDRGTCTKLVSATGDEEDFIIDQSSGLNPNIHATLKRLGIYLSKNPK